MSTLTDAQALQRTASNPAHHVWVAASAGSGKTSVLVARLQRLLLGDDQTPPTRPHRILCLTYTKAAAMEMRVRLEKRLLEWATMTATALDQSLKQLTGGNPTEKMRRRARELFAEISDEAKGLHIQTIHSFCQSVLARFPIEAGVMPGFAALDESQSGQLLAFALDEVFQEEEPAAWGAAKHWLQDRYSFAQLRTLLPGLLRDWPNAAVAVGSAGGEDAYWHACFARLNVPEDETALWRDALADKNLPLGFLRAWLEISPNPTLQNFLESGMEDRIASSNDYCQLFLTRDHEPRKNFPSKKLAQALDTHADQAAHEQQRLFNIIQKVKDQRLAVASAAMGLLLARTAGVYQRIKDARCALDFQDLITRTQQLLDIQDMGAWVHYKLDAGIDHILLDEAQDTAPDQWRVIARLMEEFFAGQGRTEFPRRLFVVGDPKQSIYSFQGADAAVFHAYAEDIAVRAVAAQMPLEIVPLSHSFRTAGNLLSLVDEVFHTAAHRTALQGSPEPIRHESIHADLIGRMRLYPPMSAAAPTKNEGLVIPNLEEDDLAHNAHVAAELACTVADWIAQRRWVAGTGRAIQPRDILILLQQRTTFAGLLLSALRTAGVPVAGNDRLKLLDMAAVQDILSFCRFLLLLEDDLNLAQLLRSPFIDMSEDLFAEIAGARAKHQTLWQALNENPRGHDITNYLRARLARTDLDTPYDTLMAILSLKCPTASSGWQALHARLGPDVDDPIRELLHLALREGQTDAPLGLEAFVDSLLHSGTVIKRDLAQPHENAVRILTVHGAKGLEAPVVILADAGELPHMHGGKRARAVPFSGAAPYFLFAPDKTYEGPAFDRSASHEARRDEHQRLLYVALTRAANEIHVFGKASAKGEVKEHSWYQQIKSAMERRDAQPTADGILEEGTEVTFVANAHEDVSEPAAHPSIWLPRADEILPEISILQPVAVTELARHSAQKQGSGITNPAAVQRGTLMHRLLELLPGLGDENAQKSAAERFLLRQMPRLDATARQQWIAEVLRVIHAPETSAFFGPDARAEVAISGVWQGTPVIGTVDRLYVTESELGILDFKTSELPPEQVPKSYARQLEIYAAVLGEIYPGRRIRAGILWTAVGRMDGVISPSAPPEFLKMQAKI